MIERHHKLALYMEGGFEDGTAKLGLGVLRYSPNQVVALIDSNHVGESVRDLSGIDREVPIVRSVTAASALGADVLVIGIANPGGFIPTTWLDPLDQAVERGMSLVNGMHDFLAPRYPLLAKDQWIWDVRREPTGLSTATGAARNLAAKRVLMVGTDMSVGKMTAGLELHHGALARGIRSAFVATGQTGMIIMGSGVPLDAIRVDFAAGAIEKEVMACGDAEVIFVEGQGSLLNPSSSATLPLLRGSMPTHLVLCHRAGMDRLRRFDWIPVPPLAEVCRLFEDLAAGGGVFPRPVTAGVCLNTFGLSEDEAAEACAALTTELGLPCLDPVRHGVSDLLTRI